MENKYKQFESDILSQGVEVSDRSNPYQCMDLAYLWVLTLEIPKATIQRLYAKDVYLQANDFTKKYFEVIPNSATFIPKAGDLAVFDKTATNPSGHIAVARGIGNLNVFQSLDQNWNGTPGAFIVSHNYNSPKLLGVLRPKVQPVVSDNKEQVLKDLYTFLCGSFSEEEIKARLASGKNIVEIGRDICSGDSRFRDIWINPAVNAETNALQVENQELKIKLSQSVSKMKTAIIDTLNKFN